MIPEQVVITGAGKGIGRELVRWFASRGWKVFAISRTQSDLASLASDFPGLVSVYQGDVSDPDTVHGFSLWVREQAESVPVVINNAGRFIQTPVLSMSAADLESQWRVNTLSTFLVTRAFLDPMIEKKRGQIINVVSVAGLQAFTGSAAYCSSKFAQGGLMKVFREELKSYNIRVTNVYPGAAYTNSWVGSGVAEDRLMTAGDVANAIGQTVNLDTNSVIEDLILRPVAGDL